MKNEYIPHISDIEKRLVALHDGLLFIIDTCYTEEERLLYRNVVLTISVGFPEIKRAKKIMEDPEYHENL